jgi:hypothetical protein
MDWLNKLFRLDNMPTAPGSGLQNIWTFAANTEPPCKSCGNETHGARQCKVCGEYYCRSSEIVVVRSTVFGKAVDIDVHKPCVAAFRRMKNG